MHNESYNSLSEVAGMSTVTRAMKRSRGRSHSEIVSVSLSCVFTITLTSLHSLPVMFTPVKI